MAGNSGKDKVEMSQYILEHVPEQAEVARIEYDWQTVFDKTMKGIRESRETIKLLQKHNFIQTPDPQLLEDALQKAINEVR